VFLVLKLFTLGVIGHSRGDDTVSLLQTQENAPLSFGTISILQTRATKVTGEFEGVDFSKEDEKDGVLRSQVPLKEDDDEGETLALEGDDREGALMEKGSGDDDQAEATLLLQAIEADVVGRQVRSNEDAEATEDGSQQSQTPCTLLEVSIATGLDPIGFANEDIVTCSGEHCTCAEMETKCESLHQRVASKEELTSLAKCHVPIRNKHNWEKCVTDSGVHCKVLAATNHGVSDRAFFSEGQQWQVHPDTWCGNSDRYFVCVGKNDRLWQEKPACPPVSMIRNRCGPLYGGRCNMKLNTKYVYCKSSKGWCSSDFSTHKNAHQRSDKYDWSPASCNLCPPVSMTRNRCGPDFGGCNKELNVQQWTTAGVLPTVYCNSANGKCSHDFKDHKNKHEETDKYDWKPTSCGV